MFLLNTMKSRLLTYSTAIAIVIIATITGVLYVTSRNQMIDEKVSVISLEVERESIFIAREFSKLYENAQSLSLLTYNIIDDQTISNPRELLLKYSESIVENNPNIVGVDLVFEPNIIGNDSDYIDDPRFQFDGQFISYITKENNQLNITYVENYDDYELYTRAVSEKTDFFTEPYSYNVQGEDKFISTVVFPIVENGLFLGLVGIDFTSEYIFETMLELGTTYERRDIIATQEGLVLLDTTDASSFGSNVSSTHPFYLEEILEVNITGEKIGTMEDGNIEMLYPIPLGSSGENWYIFSDVAASAILADVNQTSFYTLAIGLSMLAIYIVGLYFVNSSVTKPITEFTALLNEFDIETDNISEFNFDTRKMLDLELLKNKFIENVSNIKENIKLRELASTLQTNQLLLKEEMEHANTLEELSYNVLKLICQQSNSVIGALYINDEGTLNLYGKFGINNQVKESYQFGEGLVGTVAKQRKYQLIDHGEAFEPMIDYGITEINPPFLLIYPLEIDDQIIGVLEVVSIKQFNTDDIQYFNDISFVLVNGIQRHMSIEKSNILHHETKKLANELEIQQEELRVKNEELQSQQEELRVTNEELESQQEELRVANEELQSNFDQIELINKELELTKDQLQEQTDEAELSNKYKSEFLANMSHELRTPLNSILILSNLINDNEKSTPKAKEYASTIHSAGKDLLELINGILDLSKIEAGQEEINIKDWDVKGALKEINNRYDMMAQNSNIDFIIQSPSYDLNIKTDGHKVKQVLTNLVSNAIKFTSEGSVLLNVVDKEKEIEFHVTDTGIGIRPENLDVIFKEFKQIETDNKRSYSGTGLGLALCKNYAILLRGRLTVESVYGEGSTFTLILPKDAFSNEETTIPYKRKEKQLITSSIEYDEGIISDDRHRINIADKSVLIIDDDPAVLHLLRDYFSKQKIYSIVANTGENGLFLADYYLPSLIIVDIKLPKMGGADIVRKLQSNPRTKDIPIAMISGTDNPKIPAKVPFFKKPLEEKSLDKLSKLVSVKTSSDLRILLVEDDITHQQTILEYIRSQNIRDIMVEAAATKSETISMLKKNLYSLLIVDLSLSDAKDFELVEEIKQHEQFTNIPIIVYTGKKFTSEEESTLLTMVDDIIIKADLSPKRLINDIRLFMVSHKNQNFMIDQTIFKDKKVLVVDDDIRNIFALTGLLESYNIKVLYETSGQKAIDSLRKNSNPDLILMDIMMPEMDGYETMIKIRKMKKYTDTPIIALTAKTMRGDREKCIASGATEYLSKPLNKDKLLSILRVWLQ